MQESTLAPHPPSDADATIAKETSRILSSRVKASVPLRLRLLDDPARETLSLPPSAVRLLVRILDEIGRGNAVTLTPVHTELTAQRAAELLNISRPSLIQLLNEGRIAFRKVGTHRRVRLDAVIAYKRQAEAERRAALAELAAYDQELGI